MNERLDSPLSQRFSKIESEEKGLERLNEHLAIFEEATYEDLPEIMPAIYVCGAPRSGTTLLTQAIASGFDVQPVNNLIAAFWQAPCAGLRLSRKLLGDDFHSVYQSEYGRTSDIREPHEFGYFWARMLGYKDMTEPDAAALSTVDWPRLRYVITNMQAAAKKPLVFKALMPAFYAQSFCSVLPRSIFILLRRNMVDNIASVHRGRIEYAGDETAWYSIRPSRCMDVGREPPLKQSCMQVHYINQSLSRIWKSLPLSNALEINYEDFCHDPRIFMRRIAGAMNAFGANVSLKPSFPQKFPLKSTSLSAQLRVDILDHLKDLS
jgi:hypothetical protein